MPADARVQLHALIDLRTDEALLALWRFVCVWVSPAARRPPATPENSRFPRI